METRELLKKVKAIELKTKKSSQNIFSGEYHSAFKGRGMAFSEVREYQIGDEVRTIDWNVTARLGDPYVKVFEEERELTLMLLIDVSASTLFGSHFDSKKERITELSAVLSFAALQNKDKIGAIFFSDRIEKVIPPKKGKSHVLRIIRDLVNLNPKGKQTNINLALQTLNNQIKKKCMVFMISDFLDQNYEKTLKIAAKKFDLMALRVSDPSEFDLPEVGFVQIKAAETEVEVWINTNDAKARHHFKNKQLENKEKTNIHLKKMGIQFTDISTDKDYVLPLIRLFKNR